MNDERKDLFYACFANLGDCLCGVTWEVADWYGFSGFWPDCGNYQSKHPPRIPVDDVLAFFIALVTLMVVVYVLGRGAERKAGSIAKFGDPPQFKLWLRTYMHLVHECDIPILEVLWHFDRGSHQRSDAQLYHDLITDICLFVKRLGFVVTHHGVGWRAQHLTIFAHHHDGRKVDILPDGIFLLDDQPRICVSYPGYRVEMVRLSRVLGNRSHDDFRKLVFDVLWDVIVERRPAADTLPWSAEAH
jgi:hypothetical protein